MVIKNPMMMTYREQIFDLLFAGIKFSVFDALVPIVPLRYSFMLHFIDFSLPLAMYLGCLTLQLM